MQRKNNGNGSSIGTATHPEKVPFRFSAQSNTPKQSKYSCKHYSEEHNFCRKLRITCVGVRNELCLQNRLQNQSKNQAPKETNKKPQLKYGMKVKVAGKGTGTVDIISVVGKECVVKTSAGTFEHYAISDIIR